MPTPGEIVERKRVTEMMVRMREAQRDSARRFKSPTAAGVARTPRRPPAVATSTTVETVANADAAPLSDDQARDIAARTFYQIEWSDGRAKLHERVFTGTAGSNGLGPYVERCLGPVDARVARRWEARKDPRWPPPLVGGSLPPSVTDVPRKRQRQPKNASSPTTMVTHSLPSGESRLSAALWYADVVLAAEVERIRKYNEDVAEFNRQFYRELKKPLGPRRPPAPAAPRPHATDDGPPVIGEASAGLS